MFLLTSIVVHYSFSPLVPPTVDQVSLGFLELGTTFGVEQVFLPAEDDAVSNAISPPGGILMFDNLYAALYVRMYMAIHLTCSKKRP